MRSSPLSYLAALSKEVVNGFDQRNLSQAESLGTAALTDDSPRRTHPRLEQLNSQLAFELRKLNLALRVI